MFKKSHHFCRFLNTEYIGEEFIIMYFSRKHHSQNKITFFYFYIAELRVKTLDEQLSQFYVYEPFKSSYKI